MVWKATHGLTIGSRRKKFKRFMKTLSPSASTTILDVGASGAARTERAENFLEEWYPHPEQITAVGIDNLSTFKKRYPKVNVVEADGKKLPFHDKEFDIVFSNAVIEHVGNREAQRRFLEECLRVGKRVFITTPSRSFPVESHTLIPFLHWLPSDVRNISYKLLGRENEGKPGALTLLTGRSFRKLFPKDAKVKIIRQRLVGFTSVLIAIV